MFKKDFNVEFKDVEPKPEYRARSVLIKHLNKARISHTDGVLMDIEILQGSKPQIDVKAIKYDAINITDNQVNEMRKSLKTGRPFYFALWSRKYKDEIYLMKLVPFSALVKDSTTKPKRRQR